MKNMQQQLVWSLTLQAQDCNFLSAPALMHSENKTLQTSLNPLNIIAYTGWVMKVQLSGYLVLLSVDSKTR